MTDNPSWLWAASLLSFIAAIGGIVVLRGLWMEGLKHPETFENVEAQRSHHEREGRGIKWVFWGVAIEVFVAFFLTFKEGWEAHKTEVLIAQNDPLNRPVLSISANVQFTTASNVLTTNNGMYQVTQPNNCAMFSLGKYGTNGFIAPFMLVADKFDKGLYEGPGPEYWMDLHWSPAFRSGRRVVQGMSIRELGRYFNFGELEVSFIPFNSEIEGGSGVVTLNSSLEYEFVIPKQKMMGPIISCIFTNAPKH